MYLPCGNKFVSERLAELILTTNSSCVSNRSSLMTYVQCFSNLTSRVTQRYL